MKILCLHRELLCPGGSETFMLAIVKELFRLKHSVIVHSPKRGPYFNEFIPYCEPCLSISPADGHCPDAIFLMARSLVPLARTFYCHKTFISNGVLPISLCVDGFDRCVSVSKEVHAANLALGFKSDIIFNGIDTDLFTPFHPVRKKLKKVLMLSNHFPGVSNKVKEACDLSGLSFHFVGGPRSRIHIERHINQADLVVTLGRGAYEAMACERNVFVFDYRGGDGFVTPDNFSLFRNRNLSGREIKHPYSVKEICNIFKLYDPDIGPSLRALIVKDHNIVDTVSSLLAPLKFKPANTRSGRPRAKRVKKKPSLNV